MTAACFLHPEATVLHRAGTECPLCAATTALGEARTEARLERRKTLIAERHLATLGARISALPLSRPVHYAPLEVAR